MSDDHAATGGREDGGTSGTGDTEASARRGSGLEAAGGRAGDEAAAMAESDGPAGTAGPPGRSGRLSSEGNEATASPADPGDPGGMGGVRASSRTPKDRPPGGVSPLSGDAAQEAEADRRGGA